MEAGGHSFFHSFHLRLLGQGSTQLWDMQIGRGPPFPPGADILRGSQATLSNLPHRQTDCGTLDGSLRLVVRLSCCVAS